MTNSNSKFRISFFILVIAIFIVLNFFIFLPFLNILFLSLVIAIVAEPVHQWIGRLLGKRETLSAFLTTALFFVLLVGPVSFLGALVVNEASDLYSSTLKSEEGGLKFEGSSQKIADFIEKVIPRADTEALRFDIEKFTQKVLSWTVNNVSNIFSGALKVLFELLLLLLSLFYFLRDGKKFVSSLVNLSPLHDSHDRQVIDKVVVAVNSVVRGNLIIAIIQGSLSGIGFAIFGVPSPVLWGTVAALASLVPSIGTSLVLIPAIFYLFVTGSTGFAIGLAIWGALAVGLIDNFLGPILIDKGVKIHPILVLFSVLGGIGLFGPIGILMGPVLLSVLFVLLKIYPAILKEAESA